MNTRRPMPTRANPPGRRLLIALLACLASATSLAPSAAAAEEIVVYRAGDIIDPAMVARILSGHGSRPAGTRTRTLRLLDDPPVAAGAARPTFPPNPQRPATQTAAFAPGARPVPASDPVPGALSLPVRFAFDSAELLPESREQLDALAQGIRMLEPTRRITIEGHTDAAGPDHYNLILSERRAQTVRRYLVSVHGIEPGRLEVSAFGEYAPIDPVNPNAGINRRVQFRGG